MYKVIWCLKRKAGTTFEQFRDHYEASHAPLGQRHFGHLLLAYRRNYNLGRASDAAADALCLDFDCVTEWELRDEAALDDVFRLLADPAIGPIFRADEDRFLDREAIRLVRCDPRDTGVLENRTAQLAAPALPVPGIDFVQNPAHPVDPGLPSYADPARIPAHVPADLVRECQLMYGADFLAEPYEYMAAMHETLPRVFYSTNLIRNQWFVTRHEDCLRVLRQTDTFRNLDAVPFPRDPDDYFYFIPSEIDPPQHRRYRAIVDAVFCPAGIKRIEGLIRARAAALIDGFSSDGTCEFTTAFGRPFPVSIFLDVMGLPQNMRDTFVAWGDGMIHAETPQAAGAALASAVAYLKRAIAEKQAQPDEGVISLIANATIDGQPISEKEVFGFVTFLFIGGLDTVYATLNNIWLWLARNPERVREISARPDDLHAIVEELLRRFSVTFSSRYVVRDVEIGGVEIKAGDRVFACLPAANFDPAIFPDPLRVDFDRPRRTNLAFTVGVHACMGAHLARMEVKVALEEWLKRIPRFSVAADAAIAYRPGGVIGPATLPLVWHGAQAPRPGKE